MDDLAHFMRESYLQLKEQEATPLSTGCESLIDRYIENAQKLTLARREWFINALRREVAERGVSVARYFQPFAGSVILRDGEPFWGRFWIDGNYYADEGSLSRALRIALERAHGAALREDAARRTDARPLGASTSKHMESVQLGRALVASIAIAGIRYEVTREGREALKSSMARVSKKTESDSLPSHPVTGAYE